MDLGVGYYRPVKISQKGFCLATLETFIKDWPRDSYLNMKNTPSVSGGIPLM